MFVLGISHDLVISSACLIKDGKVVFAIAEERLNRIKHYKGFPKLAIKACLDHANIKLKDINVISNGWNPLNTMSYPNQSLSNNSRNRWEYLYALPNQLSHFENYPNNQNITQQLYKNGTIIKYFDHQLCHAASAFFQSGFKEAAILTVDGRGEKSTGLLGFAKNNKLNVISEIQFPDSLGLFYASITQFLGFQAESDEWKVMALGAYTNENNNIYISKFEKLYFLDRNTGVFKLNMEYFTFPYPETNNGLFFSNKLSKLIGKPRLKNSKIIKRHLDISFALQYHFEKIMLFLLNTLYKKFPSKNLVLAGGCIMNCKLNGEIKTKTKFSNIYIPSAPDDSGISVGSALLAYYESKNLKYIINKKVSSNYWGQSFSNNNILQTLNSYKLNFKISKNLNKEIATIISKKKLVGWFQGRSEFGQRSLGNRSILADPRDEKIKDIVNKSVKFRENFRPFAPAIIDKYFDDFFITNGEKEINFMEKTKRFKKDKINFVKGVVHNDGTGRVQTVSKIDNYKFYNLILSFKKITNIPILLNTSFNLNGEPIVESPDDAIRTFYSCGLDYLVIGDYIISK